jgi:hypothetical protein
VAFTRLDLLALVVMLFILSGLAVAALAANGSNSRAFFCLNNARQMAAAIALYTADNRDLFPPNPDDGNTVPGHNWCAGSVGGGMPGSPASSGAFNPDLLTDKNRNLISPYLGLKPTPFTCAADPRRGPYSGADSLRRGQTIGAARSISMNGGVGTICPGYNQGGAHSGVPVLPVNGPWLDGAHGHRANQPFATFGSAVDFGAVGADRIFLTVEEDPWSINDGTFSVSAATPKLIDFPAAWHGGGGVFSFCDGHADLQLWSGTKLGLKSTPGTVAVSPNDPDWIWLSNHATVRLY